MTRSLEARLARLERERAPALPPRALFIMAESRADAERQVAEAVREGRHAPGWPAIIITFSSGEIAHEP